MNTWLIILITLLVFPIGFVLVAGYLWLLVSFIDHGWAWIMKEKHRNTDCMICQLRNRGGAK